MIRRRLDFPAPLPPRTPIFAPGYIEMLMPRSTSRSGGWNRRRSRMVMMNWGAMGPTVPATTVPARMVRNAARHHTRPWVR